MLANLSCISQIFLLSVWQTIREIFIHKNLLHNREFSSSGTSNPHLQKCIGPLVICFHFKDVRPNAIPVQEKYIYSLNFEMIALF